MENENQKLFKDINEYLGSDFKPLIDEIVAVKKGMSQKRQSFKQELQEIKGLARSLKKNYLIKKRGDKDQFLDCPYCDIINVEKQSFRRCFENNNFIAFTPYASRFNFEIWVFPKLHLKSITEMQDEQLFDLATILKSILIKLKELNAPYNICLFYSPDESDLHFHIEICPRFSTWAGFEILTNDIINPISPEDAATFYRGEK